MNKFSTAQEVIKHIQTLDPTVCRIEPHHSSSYRWLVTHPESMGRMSYGFSNEQNLLNWANKSLTVA